MSVVENIVRVGQVSSVNPDDSTVRVAFDDLIDHTGKGVDSAPLRIIPGNTVNRQDYTLPEVGEHVVCLFLPTGQQEGFVLGSYYTSTNLPQRPAAGIYRTEYSDGTVIEYNLNTNIASVRSEHAVVVECETLTATVSKNAIVQATDNITLSARTITIRAQDTLSLQATNSGSSVSVTSGASGSVSVAAGTGGTALVHGPGGATLSSDNDSIGV